MTKRRAVFLDRDGTLIEERHYLGDPAGVQLFPWTLAALARLRATGLALVIVSNQSGIARGRFGEAELAAVQARLAALLAVGGIELDGAYYCPHHPAASVAAYRLDCDCRKPKPGLLARAARELDLELAGSWMVGDKAEDVALATGAGMRAVLVLSGQGAATAAGGGGAGAWVGADLLAAAAHIAQEEAAR
jgi:D-glycero-D-manno-heptose 1,7-bisphosphate phosphatase